MSSYRNFVLFEIGINTGLRVSDLLSLKAKDVRGKLHLNITEAKAKKKRNFTYNIYPMSLRSTQNT